MAIIYEMIINLVISISEHIINKYNLNNFVALFKYTILNVNTSIYIFFRLLISLYLKLLKKTITVSSP